MRWKSGRPVVEITNTHRPILENLQGMFGGTIGISGNSRSRACYRLTLSGASAWGLLVAIKPHCVVKQTQLTTLLSLSKLKAMDMLTDELLAEGLEKLRDEKQASY